MRQNADYIKKFTTNKMKKFLFSAIRDKHQRKHGEGATAKKAHFKYKISLSLQEKLAKCLLISQHMSFYKCS